jgi:hypothetical protein
LLEGRKRLTPSSSLFNIVKTDRLYGDDFREILLLPDFTNHLQPSIKYDSGTTFRSSYRQPQTSWRNDVHWNAPARFAGELRLLLTEFNFSVRFPHPDSFSGGLL